VNISLFINPDIQNNNDVNDSIAANNFDLPLIINNETDLNINKTNNNMDKLDININSDETTYINDSEHSKSENNIIDSENDLINLDIQNKKYIVIYYQCPKLGELI
jgi:hypothetical protein